MTRAEAAQLTREELNKVGLNNWSVRLNSDPELKFLGLCSYKDKCIILNAYHCEIHPEREIRNTVKHEVAHALTPGHRHDEIWEAKARELGCDNTLPCSNLNIPAHVFDAIRSGATVETEVVTHTVSEVKYKITQLKDKCPTCGKDAKEKFSFVAIDNNGDEVRMITLECFHIIKKIIPKATPFDKIVSNSWKPEVKNCKHDWNKNQCLICGEFRPFAYQVEGARFLEVSLATRRGGAIFDEMGLGKTIQVLMYLLYHPEAAPVLFVVKSGIKFQWMKEIYRWLGPKWIAQVIETSRDYLIPGMNAYIISYDIIVPKVKTTKLGNISKQGLDIEKLKTLGIKTVILDECQQIKNPDSTRTQQIRKVIGNAAAKVIPLSGTPWKNKGSEFFTVLNMIDSMRFYSFAAFKQRWVSWYMNGNQLKEGGIANPKEFKEYIKDIAIRRERVEVMKELPLITRNKYHTDINDREKEIYDKEVSEFVKWYNDLVMSGEENKMFQPGADNLLAKMARMRHLAGLGKIPATLEFVGEFFDESPRKKLVIFVHHKDVAVIMLDKLTKVVGPETKILQIHAGLSSEERWDVQQKFNEATNVVMVASTLASGEGLNLQTCADCVMHERQWNPANEEQAEGRFIRIGQTSNTVTATYTTAIDTIDEHLDGIVERKRVAFHNAMNKGVMPVWNQNDLMKELANSIATKHNKDNKKKQS